MRAGRDVMKPAVETNEDVDRRVRVALYDGLVRIGSMGSAAELAAELHTDVPVVMESFARLGASRAIVLEPDDPSRVRMANPFSAIPTPFAVTAAGRDWWGNCIWDSLGIAACLGTDATIRCSCGDCDQAMRVDIRDGRVEGSGLIHFGVPARHWWDDIIYT